MLPRMKSAAPSRQSPRPTKYRAAVAATPKATEAAIIFLRTPPWSATAPRAGETTATMSMPMVVAQAKRSLASAGGRSAATTDVK